MKTIRRYVRVKSESRPDETHLLVQFDDETFRCSCPGHFYRGKCRHVDCVSSIAEWEETKALGI